MYRKRRTKRIWWRLWTKNNGKVCLFSLLIQFQPKRSQPIKQAFFTEWNNSPISRVIIYQIFFSCVIGLHASRDRIFLSLNWWISQNVPRVIFPNFEPYAKYDIGVRLRLDSSSQFLRTSLSENHSLPGTTNKGYCLHMPNNLFRKMNHPSVTKLSLLSAGSKHFSRALEIK